MKKCQIVLLVLMLFVLSFMRMEAGGTNFSFSKIDKSNGLTDNSIYYIYQDNVGFIWLCTGNGLVRYDGNSFKQYTKSNVADGENINSIRITHIMQDHSGKYWFSTSDNGINIYDPEKESFSYLLHDDNNGNTISGFNVNYCYEDSHKRIWICTLGDGLDCYDPQTGIFKHFKQDDKNPKSLPSNHITSIIEDSYGSFWVCPSGEYICQFDEKTNQFKRFSTHYSDCLNLGGYYKRLYLTSKEVLLVATDGTGLYQFNIKTKIFTRFCSDYKPGNINNNNTKGLVTDPSGNIWVITDGGGINILDASGKFRYVTYDFNFKNGLTTNALYSIIRDKSDNIWIGTYKAGLLLLKEKTRTFQIVSQGNENTGLSYKSVLSILKDNEGYIWYGTDGGGLNRFDPKTGKYKYYRFDPRNSSGISNDVVKAIIEDRDGFLWISTFFGGLNKLDKKTEKFTHFKSEFSEGEGTSAANTWCLLEDSRGLIWIGNFSNGLDFFDKKTGKFTHIKQDYSDTNTLSHTQVSSIKEDNYGNIWVGTLNGLNKLDPKTLKCTRYYNNSSSSSGLSDNFITCLLFDSHNRLWVGTDDGGFNLMVKPGVFKTFGLNGELPAKAVQSMEEDNMGNIWVSTKSGLVKFDPSSGTFYNMDDVEDLMSNEFNWNSSFKDKDGHLYFGSIDGVCLFNPRQITFNKPFPKLVITDIKVFNKPLDVGKKYHGRILLDKSVIYGGKLVLTSKENNFTIDFAAIEFNKPAKIKYRYQLQGFDKELITTGSQQRNATYTNLPGGEYKFLITSTNSDGVWNNNSIHIDITIMPPFYKQWWFKLLIAFLLVGVAYTFYRRNLEKHRRLIKEEALQREKNLIERRNDELKSEIASNTMLLLRKNESLLNIKSHLEELNANEEIEKKIRSLIANVESEMEVDVYWEQFQYNFDQVYRNMLARLSEQYPDLTRVNLKLCAYLRLNLSSKEIASLMNVTLSGIDKARNRLRKKLNLQPNEDLHEFLMKF